MTKPRLATGAALILAGLLLAACQNNEGGSTSPSSAGPSAPSSNGAAPPSNGT